MAQAPLPPIGAEVVQELPPLGGEVVVSPASPADFRTTNLKDAAGAPVVESAPFGLAGLKPGVDLATGIVKGAANTVVGLGDLAYRYIPGVSAVSDAAQRAIFGDVQPVAPMMAQARQDVQPTTPLQQIGYTGEQIGEYFLPGTGPAKYARAAEALKAGGTALAQTGSPIQAGVSGAISAVLPGASAAQGAMTRAAETLETSAQKSMAQALGATKEWAKSEAAKLAPEMLRRGIGGSRPAMLDLAKTTAARVGAELDDAYRAAAAAGETVPSPIIQGNLQLVADALKVRDAQGVLRDIPGTEPVIQKLDELGTFVASLGADIPVDKAAHVKRTWDHIVSKAGLFGPKATAAATDTANAWAIREAAGSFRELLNTNPTLQALNQEAAFWTGLKKVLKETEKRTQAQSSGLIASVMAAPGAVAGAVTGGPVGALAGTIVAPQLVRVLQSPAWRTQVSGPMKQRLADALASGSGGQITSAATQILRSLPAQLRPAPGLPAASAP